MNSKTNNKQIQPKQTDKSVKSNAPSKAAKPVQPQKAPKKVGAPVKKQPVAKRTVANLKVQAPLKRTEKSNSPMKDMKMPKKGTTSEDQIQNRLKKKSPWYQSLVDPKHNAGVKIPDENGCETGTMQLVQHVPVTIGANGCAGLRVTYPYPNLHNSGSALGSNFQITNAATSTSGNAHWGNGTVDGNMIAFKSNSTLQASTQGVRIVSASITATPECTDLNDSGEGCAFQTPFDVDNVNVAYNDIVNKFGSATLANNKKKALISRWYPTQMSDDQEGVFKSMSYKDFVDPNLSADGEAVEWEFGIIYSGFPASSGTVKFEIIINYEFIPSLNTIDILDVAPSPIDPQEEMLVENWVQDIPSGGVVSDKQVTDAPAPTKVEDNGSGFGMFFDVIQELVPVATGLLSLI